MRSAGDGIVMVAYTYYPWDPRVRREAETLARRGHDVSVLCCRNEDEPREDTIGGVRVRRLPVRIRRGGALRYLFQYGLFFLLAALQLRGVRARGVHVHSLPDFLVFAAIGPKARGVPVTLDLHEALPEIVLARFPNAGALARIALAAERLSCLFADRVIVVNETIRELIAARGVPGDRITVLFNSPDVAVADESPAEIGAVSGRTHLVYAGGVDRERDLETLIRAVAELRSSLPTSLLVYGRGDSHYVSYLEGLVDGLGIREFVRFGGVLPSDRVLAHLAHSDVGVVTYERSPLTEVALPNKVFEYVVLDKPLVLPDLKAMRRAFDGAAWFYEPGNAVDLAAKIRVAALSSPEAHMKRERAQTVYEGAKWEAQAERLVAMYAGSRARAAGVAACT
jgi:glycosyltransferase involved in cell wall biosynthesis